MAMRILDWCFDYLVPWAVIGLIAVLVVGLPLLGYAFYLDSKRPTFELKKDDWFCTEWRARETTYYYHKVGNVMVPQTTTTHECMNWRRK